MWEKFESNLPVCNTFIMKPNQYYSAAICNMLIHGESPLSGIQTNHARTVNPDLPTNSMRDLKIHPPRYPNNK